MTGWDEGPVSALRARIQELDANWRECYSDLCAAEAALGETTIQRDRAVAAVRQLRAALNDVAQDAYDVKAVIGYADAALAATAEWEAP